nr:class C sortase [Enterococcus faecalis]
VNSHRLLVRGTRIPFSEGMKKTLAKADRVHRNRSLAILIFSLLLMIGIGSIVFKRIKSLKGRKRS